MAFEPKEWADGAEGKTPITAAELNRIEQGVADGQNKAVAWGDVTGKPATFAPAIGTTATTALAGNTALLALGTTATTAAKGDHVHAIAGVTGLQAALDAKATAAALSALEARVSALEKPEA